jgi:hypothetical protein
MAWLPPRGCAASGSKNQKAYLNAKVEQDF